MNFLTKKRQKKGRFFRISPSYIRAVIRNIQFMPNLSDINENKFNIDDCLAELIIELCLQFGECVRGLKIQRCLSLHLPQ